MSAEIVDFPVPAVGRSNGAREALVAHALVFKDTTQDDAERWADYTLADLWARGFKVVPVE